MHNVKILLNYGIVPTLVFDGDLLPMKKQEEASRHASRSSSMEKALAAEKKGDSGLARSFFNKAVDVTPEMCRRLMDALDKERVAYIVAPYEADSQLAFMAHKKEIDVVLTEDSDLLAYGVDRVLFKWDRDTHEGDEINRRNLGACDKLDLVGMCPDDFLNMCISHHKQVTSYLLQ